VTAAPSSANPRQSAAPIPEAPPVTMMTRPSNRPAMMILLDSLAKHLTTSLFSPDELCQVLGESFWE
jgi:hypothetical protein